MAFLLNGGTIIGNQGIPVTDTKGRPEPILACTISWLQFMHSSGSLLHLYHEHTENIAKEMHVIARKILFALGSGAQWLGSYTTSAAKWKHLWRVSGNLSTLHLETFSAWRIHRVPSFSLRSFSATPHALASAPGVGIQALASWIRKRGSLLSLTYEVASFSVYIIMWTFWRVRVTDYWLSHNLPYT